MRVDELQYELPNELIAQRPAKERDQARLMHLAPGAPQAPPEHHLVSALPELLPAGALVVVNDTRVVPARLLGRKRGTGGRVELLLLQRVGARDLETSPGNIRRADVWTALGHGRRLHYGVDVEVPQRGSGEPHLMARPLTRRTSDGLLEVALWTASGVPIETALRACGRVPLPPYIKRDADSEDEERYQTVYARHDGAAAAPTAGLHLTGRLLDSLAARGCNFTSITLHIGLGTFQPVATEDFDCHPMHAERYIVSKVAAEAVAKARAQGAPVVAIGTSTARALESAADPQRPGRLLAASGETRLLVQPGYAWRVVDGLLTNFHLPRSTLLALVCALGGTDRVLNAYSVAVRERYRFFSYGDAMLLWRRA